MVCPDVIAFRKSDSIDIASGKSLLWLNVIYFCEAAPTVPVTAGAVVGVRF